MYIRNIYHQRYGAFQYCLFAAKFKSVSPCPRQLPSERISSMTCLYHTKMHPRFLATGQTQFLPVQ